jgi:hypothetical protein
MSGRSLSIAVRIPFALLLLLLVSSQRTLAQPASGPDPTLKQPPWQRLGPIGPRTVSVLAVSPEYPGQKLLLAARNGSPDMPSDLVRSPDGGQTWEILPSPAEKLAGIQLALTPGATRTAFAWSDSTLFTSSDAGTSWQDVFTPDAGGISEVAVSPTIAQDGLAFVVASGTLWRSSDAGLTWTILEPAPGQYVQRLRLSTDFANDHALFVGLAGGPFPAGMFATAGQDPMSPGGDPESSAGVAVSTDAGNTWTPLNEGLEVDGHAYQAIEELDVSPTFARDGTLFALGWGPFETVTFGASEIPSQRAALFRSQDRGLTWQPMQTFGPSLGRLHLQVAPSPSFFDDHLVLEAISVNGPSPASSHCSVALSDDAGESWTEKLSPGSYEGCLFLQTFGSGGGFEATVLKSYVRYWSPDGGRTWGLASSPYGFQPIVASPAYAQDRTLFIGGGAGVWANGPGVVATNGMVPCNLTPVLGFGRIWSGSPDVRAAIGCATEAERPAVLRLREYVNTYCGPTRVLWVEDPAFPQFYELSDTGCGPKSVSRWDKQSYVSRLPDVPEQVIHAVVESFEGGTMLFVPRDDGNRSIVVVQSNERWEEYPDT